MQMKYEELTQQVIGAAIEVHKCIGPGLLESTYEQCLAHELNLRKISFQVQVPIPVQYKGVKLDCAYRADLLVEKILLLELKSVEQLGEIHKLQILSYMRHANVEVGLLINFNVPVLTQGLKRYMLGTLPP
jgi:GxxExxY protein